MKTNSGGGTRQSKERFHPHAAARPEYEFVIIGAGVCGL